MHKSDVWQSWTLKQKLPTNANFLTTDVVCLRCLLSCCSQKWNCSHFRQKSFLTWNRSYEREASDEDGMYAPLPSQQCRKTLVTSILPIGRDRTTRPSLYPNLEPQARHCRHHLKQKPMREQRIQETTPLEKSKLMAAGNATKVAVAHLLHAKLPSRPGAKPTANSSSSLSLPSLVSYIQNLRFLKQISRPISSLYSSITVSLRRGEEHFPPLICTVFSKSRRSRRSSHNLYLQQIQNSEQSSFPWAKLATTTEEEKSTAMGIKVGHFFFVFFLFFPQNPKKFSTQKKKKKTNKQRLHPHKLLHDTRSQSLSDFYNCRCIEQHPPMCKFLQQRSVPFFIFFLFLCLRKVVRQERPSCKSSNL